MIAFTRRPKNRFGNTNKHKIDLIVLFPLFSSSADVVITSGSYSSLFFPFFFCRLHISRVLILFTVIILTPRMSCKQLHFNYNFNNIYVELYLLYFNYTVREKDICNISIYDVRNHWIEFSLSYKRGWRYETLDCFPSSWNFRSLTRHLTSF